MCIRDSSILNIIEDKLPETEFIEEVNEPSISDYKLSCSKIEKILDFRTEFSIEDSVDEMINFLQENEEFDPYSLRHNNT